VPPAPPKTWSCTVSGGVCTCTAGGTSGGSPTCPAEFYTQSQYGCCNLGGPVLDPASYNSCVCQLYSAIPDGANCYTLPVALGQTYGHMVDTCPNGAWAPP
jgi:hypothetical protein